MLIKHIYCSMLILLLTPYYYNEVTTDIWVRKGVSRPNEVLPHRVGDTQYPIGV